MKASTWLGKDLKKIDEKLTDGKAQLRQEKGGPTRHLSTVREQESVLLFAILKGYKLNVGMLIENSIMRYHEGNKRGVIPHPATITVLCLKAGVQ